MPGNDIVDLDFWEPPKHQHVRYLERVCTPEEASGVRRSSDPMKALAVVWASKEAAFKLFSKRLARSHFVPKEYVIQIADAALARIDTKLLVVYAGLQTEVSIFTEERWVHAIAHVPAMHIHWAVREIEKCYLGNRKARGESEAVRFLASTLLEELDISAETLYFEGRVPKLRHKSGQETGIDVTLAHHGAFAAAAVAWPAGLSFPQPLDKAGFAKSRNAEAACFTCTA